MSELASESSTLRPREAPTELAPERVLAHAEVLAELSAGPGPLSAVHARRAVGAAYYAVLHRVCLDLAGAVLPAGSDAERFALCRSVSHAALETVARWLVGAAEVPEPERGLVRVAAGELSGFAGYVLPLQDWRMRADYDHLAAFGHPLARLACRGAREAIAALDAARGRPSGAAFSALLLHRGLR